MRHNNDRHYCIFCHSKLSQNTPREHIIPQGIGGALSSRNITCASCNSELNEMLDVHLVKHFGMLVNILALRGTKGNPQPITVKMVDGDEKYRLQYGGIIEEFKKVRRTKNPDGTTLSEIRASSTEEMLSLMADIRKSMKEVLHEEIVKAPNPDDYAAGSMMEMHLSTGDDIVQRAIVRIAINFLAFKERPRQAIEEICKYALGQVSGYVVNPYFPDNPAWESFQKK